MSRTRRAVAFVALAGAAGPLVAAVTIRLARRVRSLARGASWPGIVLALVGCGTSRGGDAVGGASAASADASESTTSNAPIGVEAGFVEVPPRTVMVKGRIVTIRATARLFYNLRPADSDPEDRPIFIMNNGFAAEIVRAYGTGPTTVVEGGAVMANPTPLTSMANLVYLEPRQSGYSYDVLPDSSPDAGADGSSDESADGSPDAGADCSPDVFNEYVDAADSLFGALDFLEAHPQLRGPVYWFGESYAGVRITWILTYLRGRWDLSNYADPVLAAKIAADSARPSSLMAGQILLEAWLAGGAHATAIANECADPAEIAAVSATLPSPCAVAEACDCADDNDRSLYNFGYTVEHQTERETEGSEAHIDPSLAQALLGVPLTAIAGLAPEERANGFRCSPPDDTVPAQDPIVSLLGPLPGNQWYYVPYSPLMPGKETQATTPDWDTQPFEGTAFLDNLHDVPAFETNGALDLVVPNRALAPALASIAGASNVDGNVDGGLGVLYPDGERVIAIAPFPTAGHMITMLDPADLATDLAAWLAAR